MRQPSGPRGIGAIAGVVVGLAALCAGAPPAQAALKVAPSRTTLIVQPGQTRAGTYTLENTGDEPIRVAIEPEDWSGGTGGGRGPVRWLSVHPTDVTVSPGKPERVQYTVQVPSDAEGELRVQVFFTSEQLNAAGKPTLRSRLGTIIYVNVEGTAAPEAAIRDVTASYTAATPGAKKPDQLSLAINIRNSGNAHIAPEGRVIVQDDAGRGVARFPLRGGWGLLPNEEDAYHAIGSGVYLSPGHYTVRILVTYGGDLHYAGTTTRTYDAEVSDDYQVLLTPADADASAHGRKHR